MKRRIFTILILVCILMSFFAFPVNAKTSGDCGDNATWSLSESGVLTISGTGAIMDYIYSGANLWPNIYAPWREYAASKIKKVVINPGITRIGDNAFCGLYNATSVSIPNTVTSIGESAFGDMSALTQITIPDSVVKMEKSLFVRCKALSSVKLPSGLTTLPEGIFKECYALKNIDLPKGLTEIGGSAFREAGITSIVIPEGVTLIDSQAFQYSSLQSIKLPSTLQKIGMHAFEHCALTSVVLPAGIRSIARSFGFCYALTSVRFEGNAPELDNYVFDSITATVYYPKDNPTWTESVRKDYDGTLTWVGYCGNGHQWSQWKTEREATCALAGVRVRSCTQCDMTEEESIAKPEHKYISEVTPPTCKDDGFTTHTCKECNYKYTDSVTPAGPHAYGQWEILKEATCLEKGSRQHSCIACDIQETEEIDLAEHIYRDVVTEPSCTQGGFTTHTCTVCEHSFEDAFAEQTEHTYGQWKKIKSASWFSEGEQYRKCEACDAEQTQVLPKIQVNWVLLIVVVAVGTAIGIVFVYIRKKKCGK